MAAMDIRPRNRIRNKLSHLLRKARAYLENEIHEGFDVSGEASFIKQFMDERKGKKTVVFDVGACEGDWSKMVIGASYKKIGPTTWRSDVDVELHAFEPVADYNPTHPIPEFRNGRVYEPYTPNETHPYQKTAWLRSFHFVWNKVAVSEIPGECTFYQRSGISDSSFYERRLARHKQGLPEKKIVSAIRLDDYIEENGITHIDLLKIDTEGCELSVLKSLGKYLTPEFVPLIQFEYGNTYVEAGVYLQDVYELLKDYRICRVHKNHLEEMLYTGSMEDFMFVNYVAIAK